MSETCLSRAFRVLNTYGSRGVFKGLPRAFQVWYRRKEVARKRRSDELKYREILDTMPRDEKGFIQMTVQGNTMKLLANDPGLTRDLLLNGGIREPGATRIMQSLLHGDMTILELGANQGYYLLQEAARTSAKSQLFAFEPHPTNVRILHENIRLNGFQDRIHLTQAAVSDRSGDVTMITDACSNFHRVADKTKCSSEGAACITVPCVSLDEFCAEHGIETIDLVRMDVEGHEMNIIDGARRILQQSTNCILFLELHTQLIRNMGRNPLELLNCLQDAGFGCFAITGHGPRQMRIEAFSWSKLLKDLPYLLHDYGAHMFFSKTPEAHAQTVRHSLSEGNGHGA